MRLNNETRLAVLFGKPLGQSLSVRLQNMAYEASGINMVYLAEELEAEALGPALAGLKYLNFAGCGVTKPYKVDVMQYLDFLEPLCEKIGACNTVVKREGKLIGYNTDADGFYHSLTEEGSVNVPESTFFCFGAGGAGRAICAALAHYGAKKIYVTDYYSVAAEELCREMNEKIAPVFEAAAHGDYSSIRQCDVIMNASGVGMGHSIGESPMPENLVSSGKLYFDACYNPEKTQFLLNAQKHGGRILNGLGMLVWQGVAQIELWTGQTIEFGNMRGELLEILNEMH